MDNKNKIMLRVSQGCYAEITTKTPENIVGLFTDCMGPCVCLIVTNTNRSHFFLAHVDSYMNIADPDLGLPAWIRKIQNSSDDKNIEIHCGEGFQEGVFPINYWMLICKILQANNMKNLINHIEMYGVCNMSATIITRHKQKVALYSDIKYNLDGKPIGGIRTELSDRGIQIIDCKQIGAQTRSYFIGCSKEEVWNNIKALEMCEYIKMKYEICQETKLPFTSDGIDTSLPFPPICCYDGIGASISIERYKDKINKI